MKSSTSERDETEATLLPVSQKSEGETEEGEREAQTEEGERERRNHTGTKGEKPSAL